MIMKKTTNFHLIIFILASNFNYANVARVLFFPTPNGSHVTPMIYVAKHLQQHYNHSVTFVLTKHLSTMPLLGDLKADIIIAETLSEMELHKYFDQMLSNVFTRKQFSILNMLNSTSSFRKACEFCTKIIENDTKLQKDLDSGDFDIVIVNNFPTALCLNFIAYRLSVPVIHIGTFNDAALIKTPTNPSFILEFPFASFSEAMTFKERLINHAMFFTKLLIPDLVDVCCDFSSNLAPEKKYISVREMQSRVAFHLIDSDILLDYPRPSMPNTAFVGGLFTRPAKPLPSHLATFMDSAFDGVVIVSFGSILRHIPDDLYYKMSSSFKKLPKLKFIWKIGNVTVKDDNIYKLPWFPQNDLLAHKHTKAFITHCGKGGQFEALYHGVPMVGMPIFAEQPYNSIRMSAKHYGIRLDIFSFETDELVAAIKSVVYDDKYRKSIQKASKIFHSRPNTPSQRAAYWIDHVIKYGGEYLHSKGTDMPLYQYLSIDVFLFYIVCCTAILYSCYIMIRKATVLCRRRKKEKQQ